MHAVDLDARIALIAQRQHSLFTVRQARQVGFTDDAMHHRITRGRWRRVRRGVLAIAGAAESWEQSVLAAVLAVRSGAVASHSTALRLWGIDVPRRSIEITVPVECKVTIPGVTAHRSGTLTEQDVASVHGIPVVTATRALFDTSSLLDDATFGKLFDEGLRTGVAKLTSLRALARRLPGIAPGRSPQRVERILRARIPGYDAGDSDLETHVLEVLTAAGLPVPVRQYRVNLSGRFYKLDLSYPEHMIVIEADGFGPHGTRSAFDDDRVRQNALILVGWRMLRFTTRSSDDEIIDSVRQALFGNSPGPEARRVTK